MTTLPATLRPLGLPTAVVLAGALALGGCGDGRKDQAYAPPAPTQTVSVAAPAPVPPVIGAADQPTAQASLTPAAKAATPIAIARFRRVWLGDLSNI